MSDTRISAALIVKDEQRFLADNLRSISDHVDEIVVVDTGSTDGTVEIAKSFNCVVRYHAWTGNFADARNRALDEASGDWILYIDADERLVVPGGQRLRGLISAEGCVAQFVDFVPRVGFTPYHEIRLFRRHPHIRFRGAIHETVHPDIEAMRQSTGLGVSHCDVRIVHLGYEGDLTRKNLRNTPLLKRAVAENPERVFLHAHLGECLHALGETEQAVFHLKKAVYLSRQNPNRKQHIDGANAWMLLIGIALQNSPSDAFSTAEEARVEYPNHKAIALSWAKAAFEAKRDMQAIPVLDELLSIDEETFCEPLTAYDKRLFRDWPADLLGAIYARHGNFLLAANCYQQASDFAPDIDAYRHKAQYFSAVSQSNTPPDGHKTSH